VKGVRVEDNHQVGVLVLDPGSRVEVEGGSVSGSKESNGISAEQGGHAVVKDAEVGEGVTIRGCGQGDRQGC